MDSVKNIFSLLMFATVLALVGCGGGSGSSTSPPTDVKVAAGDGNRLAVAWIADGTVYATVTPGGDTPGGFVPAVALGGPGASVRAAEAVLEIVSPSTAPKAKGDKPKDAAVRAGESGVESA